ncbi:MAG TPA: hypothetical protein VEA80_10025 [Vitreimonas sp.]|uniref:hypothetical protein n=1 Tax=Vitreimonas sp. TaxID=3069702 RepID=UPI002D314BF3|nr:hypothetical protein [Vitreimonas sp.]HYD87802.1 hypothetical protein [Vitreimonas sp.]
MNREASRQAEHALRQANRAAKQGDPAAAERWSKTAERLAAAAATVNTGRAEEAEAARLSQEQAEEVVVTLFVKAAFLAHVMVHAPLQAPAAFEGLVKLWREHNLGEGAEDAAAAAARLAASQAAFLEGRFEDSLPDFLREHMDEEWRARREALAERPVIPRFWEDEA